MPSVVLKCIICPKKPNFSDVSHLLTHVSSKGHLSHFFKLQVRSHQEPEAVELLEVYDRWYKEHNLAGLLSERMLTKEAKKGNGNATVENASSSNRTSKIKKESTAPKRPEQPSNSNSLPDYLDPRMSLPYIAPESRTRGHEASRVSNSTNGVSTKVPGPCVQLWPTNQPKLTLPPRGNAANGWKMSSDSTSDDTSPLVPRKRPWVDQVDTHTTPPRRTRRPVTPDPFVDNSSLESAIDENEEESPTNGGEATRLKGILWPGMDIFDSATEQMRKKRNQKKDGSILLQMEKTSEKVEATELVFSPGGTLRRERPIGLLEDLSSPLHGETPIPKQRITRPRRPVLAGTDPNLFNLRGQRRKPAKTANRRHTVSLEELSRQTLPLLEGSPSSRSLQYFGNHYAAADEDFRLTYNDIDQKPRGGFAIFDDNKDQLHSALREALAREEEAVANAAGIGRDAKPHYGTFTEARPLLHQHGIPNNYQLHDTKAFTQSRSSEYSMGKENMEPMLNSAGQMETHAGHGSWSGQHGVDGGQYSAHYFYGSGPQHGFGAFAENDAFGYSCNPLSYSYPHIQPRDGLNSATPRSHDTPAANEKAKTNRVVSPDGTVSDVDRDDYGNIYLAGLER
ncbi:hypothetical protein AJ79_04842 [Helicocarpus griseus UAMH5409]|uniref:Uncharacterized protein n=1 Tax=Helicocarpus griseus UAMH5409 TaxID=1447875 RepID=A0A2B7XSL1_9EURO|nr:hypothetical protein AJ79_04842 [Helicocarpus griseus UAMH5409]